MDSVLPEQAASEALACAGATKPCPNCEGYRTGNDCPSCHGTGRSYVLPDAVRVPCSNCEGVGIFTITVADGDESKNAHEEDEPCTTCHGLGWTPVEGLEPWLDAIQALCGPMTCMDFLPQGDGAGIRYILDLDNPETGYSDAAHGKSRVDAALAALKQALVAQGATLGSVPEEVRR